MSGFQRIRRVRDEGYTSLASEIFWDPTISAKAKAVLTTVFALPESWNFNVKGFLSLMKEGREAVNAAIKELIENGYAEKHIIRNDANQFAGVEYVFYETTRCEKKKAENAKRREKARKSPQTGFPTTGNPTTGNPHLLKKDLNKELLYKELIYSDRDFSQIQRQAFDVFHKWFPDVETDRFIKFLISQVIAGAAENPEWVDAWGEACQRFALNGFNPCQKMVDAYYENLAGVPMADRFQ